jgi:hypothetical protein
MKIRHPNRRRNSMKLFLNLNTGRFATVSLVMPPPIRSQPRMNERNAMNVIVCTRKRSSDSGAKGNFQLCGPKSNIDNGQTTSRIINTKSIRFLGEIIEDLSTQIEGVKK